MRKNFDKKTSKNLNNLHKMQQRHFKKSKRVIHKTTKATGDLIGDNN